MGLRGWIRDGKRLFDLFTHSLDRLFFLVVDLNAKKCIYVGKKRDLA